MTDHPKKRRWPLLLLLLLLLTAAAAGLFWYFHKTREERRDAACADAAKAFVSALDEEDLSKASAMIGGNVSLQRAKQPETAAGQAYYDAWYAQLRITADGAVTREGLSAATDCVLQCFDADEEALSLRIVAMMQEKAEAAAQQATRLSDLYQDDLSFREEFTAAWFEEVYPAALAESSRLRETKYRLKFVAEEQDDTRWAVEENSFRDVTEAFAGRDFDAAAERHFEEALRQLSFVPLQYSLPTDAHVAYAPAEDGFGQSFDPADVRAVLEDPRARQLIGDKELFWHEDLPFIPTEPFSWYLDETILVLIWKEPTARSACCTYAEVFIADGSQLCRKIVNDTYGITTHKKPSQLAAETNAVLATGGDMYMGYRLNGIRVYEGEVRQFEPHSTDSCFFTSSGELIFIGRDRFATQQEAQAFVDAHDVRFSVCFGPVVITEGKNVMPSSYLYGEIHDRYARAAIATKGDRLHYLMLNINEQGPSYWHLAALEEAVTVLLAHGVTEAYMFDGGQTATTILCGHLINRPQFGEERGMSVIVFFGSALPPRE